MELTSLYCSLSKYAPRVTLNWEGLETELLHKEKTVNNSVKCSLGHGAWFVFFFSFLYSAFSTARLSEGGINLYRHISCFPEDCVERLILLRSAESYYISKSITSRPLFLRLSFKHTGT